MFFEIFTILFDQRFLNLELISIIKLVSSSCLEAFKITESKKFQSSLSLYNIILKTGLTKTELENIDEEYFTFIIKYISNMPFSCERQITSRLSLIKIDPLYPLKYRNNKKLTQMLPGEIIRVHKLINQNSYLSSIINIATKPVKKYIDDY